MSVTIGSCFNVGDLVLVNDLLQAWIIEKDERLNTVTFTIKYMLGGRIENNVPLDNISVIEMYSNEVSTTRSGFTRTTNSQLLQPTLNTTINTGLTTNSTTSNINNSLNSSTSTSNNQQPSQNNNNNSSDDEEVDESDELRELKDALIKSFNNKTYTNRSNAKIYEYLKAGMSKPKGWLRYVIDKDFQGTNTQLKKTERFVLGMISCLFSGYTS